MIEFTVKRFVVFSGDQYYPDGGWRDYRSSNDTLFEAQSAATSGDWRHIVDLMTGQTVDSANTATESNS